MFTAYAVVTLVAVVANRFSSIAAALHWRPILPGIEKAGVPVSWLTFPIGTLKTAGAVGLLPGFLRVPYIGAGDVADAQPSKRNLSLATLKPRRRRDSQLLLLVPLYDVVVGPFPLDIRMRIGCQAGHAALDPRRGLDRERERAWAEPPVRDRQAPPGLAR